MLRPGQRLLLILALWTGVGFLVAWIPSWVLLWQASGVFILLLGIHDARNVVRLSSPLVERKVAGSLPLGELCEVDLTLSAPTDPVVLEVFDEYPSMAEAVGMPCLVHLAAQQQVRLSYRIRPTVRGSFHFPGVHLRILSPWGLWQQTRYVTHKSDIKVYPNFAAMTRYTLLATENRLGQLGIRKLQRRGEGLDFHQLREYRYGDTLRQIDWNATARQKKLISKEYQDERDQQIIFLIDCGQRMLAHDGVLSHFDHTLNALLLLSYVALRQGDALGLLSFSGERRWLAPRKGAGVVKAVLNSLYDVQPTLQTSDYLRAAEDLMHHQKRRALVILVSNLRDQENDELLPALKLLHRKHLVMLASLRETIIDNVLETPPHNFTQALRCAATLDYLHHRRQAHQILHQHGILYLDTVPEQLPVQLINRYLDIKRSGRL
jgi:uncharacterized protein (DUF58 family)